MFNGCLNVFFFIIILFDECTCTKFSSRVAANVSATPPCTNSPDQHGHPDVLAVLVDVSPRVLDDLPLGVRQRLGAPRTLVAARLCPPYSQQVGRRRHRRHRRRLPARHPPAAQRPGGSQQCPREVGSEGRGEGDGELRPQGGTRERSEEEKVAEEETPQQADSLANSPLLVRASNFKLVFSAPKNLPILFTFAFSVQGFFYLFF